MSVLVFSGPTLSEEEVSERLDCVCLGPAAQGDVYRASLRQPQAIAIIDGYFDHICAVWHKEILWALRQGIPVYGSSSIGALRAAELDAFGMIGVGAVYEAFRDGLLEDDDEVAVLHGPAGSRYAAATEAMVNIRATLRRACESGVIASPTAAALARCAKDIHYTDRRYDTVLREADVPRDEVERFTAWLPSGRVDQKRDDAVALLERLAHDVASGLPEPIGFEFEYTTLFDDLRRRAGELDLRAGASSERLFTDAILDEARLAGVWPDLLLRAAARRLALEDARRQRLELRDGELVDAVIEMRAERGLVEPEDLAEWLDRSNLTGADYVRLMEQEALIRRVFQALGPEIVTDALDLLRLDGRYTVLADRALAKRSAFATIDADPPDAALYEEARRLVRGERTTEAAMQELGFETAQAFDRAAIGELFHRVGDLR